MRESKFRHIKVSYIDLFFFSVLVLTLSYFMWRLIICQTIYAGRDDGYRSDILAYMQTVQGVESGYTFPYPVYFWIGKLFYLFMPVDYAVTLAEVLLNALALIITKYYFEKILIKGDLLSDKWYCHLIISFVSIACFMLSMWWLPRFGKYVLPLKYQVYLGTYTGNPWHNATYIATRPFAIATFFSFIPILDSYEKKIEVKDFVIFGISLLLTTMTKPSFTFVFVSCAGLVMAYRLIKNRFANLKNTLILAGAFLPTFIALLYQFHGVFGAGNTAEEHGIGIGWFDVWKTYNQHVVAAIFYANAFAILFTVFFWKEIKNNTMFKFTLIFFIVSILEAGVLYEKGERFIHFNFGWGYMHGIFFFEMIAALMLLKKTFARENLLRIIILWIIFAIHLVAGIFYFKGLYYGLDYETLLPCTWLLQ